MKNKAKLFELPLRRCSNRIYSMARIRAIKPDFFRHKDLYDAEVKEKLPLRVAFSGLWTVADREGRFKWKPDDIKLDILPYDKADINKVLWALWSYGFITPYIEGGNLYAFIPTWHQHQVINNRESKSRLPEPKTILTTRGHAWSVSFSRVTDILKYAQGEGKGKEGNKEGEGRVDAVGEQKKDEKPKGETKPPQEEIPPPSAHPPFLVFPKGFSDDFSNMWAIWRDYKERDHKFKYKSAITEQAAMQTLVELGRGIEEDCKYIIRYAISRQWEGFYLPDDLKNKYNGKQQTSKGSGLDEFTETVVSGLR